MKEATPFRVSVIIPTKNRPADLERTIETLLLQTIKPFEIIIVDQSASRCFTKPIPIALEYVHDPTLSGAAVARNVAMDHARGDIWLFLDDDVLLEANFIEEILAAYQESVIGVSGIITNYSVPPIRQDLWETIFQRGPFRDERQRVYRRAERLRDCAPIRVRKFTGALMSFRASAVREHRFDTSLTGACPGEDIEFCAGLGEDAVLLINPRARLIHNRSLEARDPTHWVSVAAQVASYLRERHWRKGLWNNLCYRWLLVGYAALGGFSSLKNGSSAPWRAWKEGIRSGKEIAQGPR